jgi:hypothetical protein
MVQCNTGYYSMYIKEDLDSVTSGIKKERWLNHTHKGLTPYESKSTTASLSGVPGKDVTPSPTDSSLPSTHV